VADPKGCFGSCPTFYLEGGGSDRPRAEGFSAAIARVLEERDVDALGAARRGGERVALTMRNEALETHAVRRVRLLAAPPAAGRDLAARETVELSFPRSSAGPSGIVVSARHTMMSTFLFYQSLAYVGRGVGELLAAVERGGREAGERVLGMARVLGDIEVEVAEGDGEWTAIGRFDEAGPIAGDVRVLPFHATGRGPVRVRLRLARGHWRVGAVALARLLPPVEPTPVEAVAVEKEGKPDPGALATLRSGTRHLVTVPGDAYRIAFVLPALEGEQELFLESEGYYYEWMRDEWMAEEDPRMAALVLADPAEALRRLASPYKQREAGLERAFWPSRVRK
jgi:hypothetical protein